MCGVCLRLTVPKNGARPRKILAKYGVHVQLVDPRLAQALRTAAAMDEQGVAVGFGKLRSLGAAFTSQFASNFTPPGTCMVTGGLPNAPFPRSKRIDAGASLTFDGPMGRRTLQRASNGQYFLSLGSGFPNATLPTGVYSMWTGRCRRRFHIRHLPGRRRRPTSIHLLMAHVPKSIGGQA